MTLVVEDGTGKVDAESYLSVADADTYHSNMGNSAWTGTTAVKEAALRKATQYLDAKYTWVGTISSTTQALNWPREGVEDYQGRELDDMVPSKLEAATAELALSALSGPLISVTTNSNYATRQKVGEIEVEYAKGAPTGNEYGLVDSILDGLFSSKLGASLAKLARV